MDQNQQELRRAAAEAFMESLEQLQETLNPGLSHQETQPVLSSESPPESAAIDRAKEIPPSFDLSLFEQAAADIEQFLKD